MIFKIYAKFHEFAQQSSAACGHPFDFSSPKPKPFDPKQAEQEAHKMMKDAWNETVDQMDPEQKTFTYWK